MNHSTTTANSVVRPCREPALKLYVLHDAADPTGQFPGWHGGASVTFGWTDRCSSAMLRVVWLDTHGGTVWSFDETFERDAALLAMPPLRCALEGLSPSAGCDELVAMLEGLGFVDGRKPGRAA